MRESIPQAGRCAYKPVKFLSVLILAVMMLGCNLRSNQPPAEEWLDVQVPTAGVSDLAEGKKVYLAQCARCHGQKGDGRGPDSLSLFPKPRDFTSGEYKFKTTLSDESPSDADLFRTISFGMKGTAMQPWAALSAQERWNVIAYIKTFAINSATRKNIFQEKSPKRFVQWAEPQVNPVLASRQGEALFFGKGKCNDCHGPGKGSADKMPHGDGPLSRGLVDDWGYPIRPTDLAAGTIKRGNSPKEIYVTITVGMMGTPMPTFQDTLTDEERWKLAYYVSQLNRRSR